MNSNTKGVLFAVLATLLWSVNMVVASGVKDHIPPIGLAFWRWTVACLALAPFALPQSIRDFTIIKKNGIYLFATALLGITIFNTLIYFAGKTTTAVNLSLLAISIPLFIIVLSRMFYNEKVSITKVFGIVTIVTGVLILLSRGSLLSLFQINFTFGDVLMLIACFFFACYTLLVQHKPAALVPNVFLFSVFVLGTFLLLPFYIYEHVAVAQVVFNLKTMMIFLYVGVFASLVSFYLWNEAIRLIGTSKTAIIYYLIPVFSGLLAYLFLNQAIIGIQLISMGIIISGLLLTNKK